MPRVIPGTLVLLAAIWVCASGNAPDPRLRDAELAWDRGDYPAALRTYLALMEAPDADRLLEPIALQTGELYRTMELTTDGGAPKFSPDGRHLTYEVGRGVSRKTRLARADAPTRVVAELDGHGASFSPDGARVAYLELRPTAEMLAAESSAAAAEGTDRTTHLARLAELTETAARVMIRDLRSGAEQAIDLGGRRKSAIALAADGTLLFTGSQAGGPDQVFVTTAARGPTALGVDPGHVLHQVNATGSAAILTREQSGRGGRGGSPPSFGLVSLPQGTLTLINGSAPAFSADGQSLAYVTRTGDRSQLMLAPASSPGQTSALRAGSERLDQPAFSHDGSRIAFQMMTRNDWELHVITRDGSGETRITREIQHDLAPLFLSGDRLLGLMGEPRHRRSYLYDLAAGTRTRLFHNNSVRTIAPEYEWVPSPDGTKLLIVAERDGDTVSVERGVYLMDLANKITRDDLRDRIRESLAAEESLRARGQRLFSPISEAVKRVLGDASTSRVYSYERALFDFDSKHISQPGNRLASTYLFETYKSFGYAPEYQWFDVRTAAGGRTANVIATLKGTIDPEIVYVVSSHYDSVANGPGADDDSSGTAALLETARILARHPQPATIVFASFTGEESGLLGSREFVRRAVAGNVQIAGALNNDMIGWANDHRMDGTIRYANSGIRDIQHAAAIQFTNLITYDSRYFKGTDALAYYEAYGDISGGIGAYPVLGNPHYHQSHDTLDTINHQLVTEVAKTTTASVMLLASSPSRVAGLTMDTYQKGAASVSWRPSPERGISGYVVAWGPAGKPEAQQVRVTKPTATIKAAPGTVVSVRAVNQKGLESWDSARVVVE
jgi:Tol biopolymer transport system component